MGIKPKICNETCYPPLEKEFNLEKRVLDWLEGKYHKMYPNQGTSRIIFRTSAPRFIMPTISIWQHFATTDRFRDVIVSHRPSLFTWGLQRRVWGVDSRGRGDTAITIPLWLKCSNVFMKSKYVRDRAVNRHVGKVRGFKEKNIDQSSFFCERIVPHVRPSLGLFWVPG